MTDRPARLERVTIDADFVEAVAEGRRHHFPPRVIEDAAEEFGLATENSISATEFEAALVAVLAVVLGRSWKMYRPVRGTHGSPKKSNRPHGRNTLPVQIGALR